MSAALTVYRAVWEIGMALRLPSLMVRGRRRELEERLGAGPAVTPGALWIHAASVGEMTGAQSLIRELRAGDVPPILLTSMTRTGRERAMSLRPDVGPMHVPLDAPGPIGRFLDRTSPRALVVLETELWPNLLLELARRGVPWAVASGRISRRSMQRLRLARGLVGRVLQAAAAVAARTDEDAGRFLDLGARPEAVRVAGDLKDDRDPGPWSPPPSDRPRWVAACTRPGEEEEVLAALRVVAARIPAGELLLAPRHPERFREVGEALTRANVAWRSWEKRSDPPEVPPGWHVVLVDEMGVMNEAYRRAACAFVGGSLRPLGGHSPLEAATAGRPVLMGSHTENCRASVARLERAGALQRVESGERLGRHVADLLTCPEEAQRLGRAAHAVASEGSGAAKRTVALLRERGVVP